MSAPAPEEVVDLALEAMEHALQTLQGGGKLIPFAVIVDQNGKKAFERFIVSTGGDARQLARQTVSRTKDCTLYAIAADGTIEFESGEKVRALLIEAGRRGDAHGYAYALELEVTEGVQGARPKGDPDLIDHPPLL